MVLRRKWLILSKVISRTPILMRKRYCDNLNWVLVVKKWNWNNNVFIYSLFKVICSVHNAECDKMCIQYWLQSVQQHWWIRIRESWENDVRTIFLDWHQVLHCTNVASVDRGNHPPFVSSHQKKKRTQTSFAFLFFSTQQFYFGRNWWIFPKIG